MIKLNKLTMIFHLKKTNLRHFWTSILYDISGRIKKYPEARRSVYDRYTWYDTI